MFLTVHTHYDNLKVARNAPLEVIRAAYRVLSQKHHPDKNPGSAEAARVMAIFNAAYVELSDPVKRAAHDAWIAAQEKLNVQTHEQVAAAKAATAHRDSSNSVHTGRAAPQSSRPERPNPSRLNDRIFKYGLLGLLALVAWLIFAAVPQGPEHQVNKAPLELAEVNSSSAPHQEAEGARPHKSSPPARKAAPSVSRDPLDRSPLADFLSSTPSTTTTKPLALAPNGRAWPTTAAYLSGYKQLNNSGLSTVTIDNSQMNSNAYVKVVDLRANSRSKGDGRVRHIFIPAFGKFTARNLTAGEYDVRYQDLSSRAISRTESFELKEFADDRGTTYSNITLTLYKVQNGNMNAQSIPESDF